MPDIEQEFYDPSLRVWDDCFSTPTVHSHWDASRAVRLIEQLWQHPETETSVCVSEAAETIEERFRKLADEWSSEVGNVSSVNVLTSHPKYQKIISLGWSVVPYLLADLQSKRGYWFPALNAITGIRPFDPRDAGNVKRMADAWIKWGKNKQII